MPNFGLHERRITELEECVKSMEVAIVELNSLKDQIKGMVALVKYVGWGGLVAIIVFIIKTASEIKVHP